MFLLFILACVPAFGQQKGGATVSIDTFKLADKLLAKKKFRKASRLYRTYRNNHPGDLNSLWKLSQTEFWLNNFRQSDSLYRLALRQNPANDYLRLNYIHSLLDMGHLNQADDMLTDMELTGKDYSDLALLRAKLNYYKGDYTEASAYLRKSLNAENNNAEAHDLEDQLALAQSPVISLSSGYLSDNQPFTAVISSLKAENYFSKYADLYLTVDEYHYMQNATSDAPMVRVGDKLFFPNAGLHINVGAGVYKYPVVNQTGWTGNISLNEKISPHFDIDVNVEHLPYFDTKLSIDTIVFFTRESAMLNWHLRDWSAQVAILNSTYMDNNNVYGAYGWVLAPIVHSSHVQLLAGASTGYSTSGHSTYRAQDSLSVILDNFAVNPNITGEYLYFTPNQLFTAAGRVSLTLSPSKKVSINVSGDLGYGSMDAPYLFLNKNNNGNIYIERGFAMQAFTPADAKVAINYHIDKTWLLSAKYAFTNTYFFTSNFAGIGIQKSFQHHRKTVARGTSSTFSRLIDDIESELQALYKTSDEEDLRNSVAGIREQLVKLRDAQRNKGRSESLQGTEQSADLQDRYDDLNEMVEELDAVDLNDYKGSGKSKKEWLVDKLYELTSIKYNGIRD